MSKAVLDAFGESVVYRLCTLQDIKRHFRCVRSVVEPGIEEEYKARMRQAVEESTAYCVEGSNVFLYYLKESKYVSEGVSFAGKSNPVKLLALLTAMTLTEDTDTAFMRFYLHHKSNIKDFRALIEADTLEGQTEYPKRVTIRTDKLRDTLKELLWVD